MRLLKFIAFLLTLTLQAQPDKVLETWKKDKDLQHASISWCARDLKSGQVLSEFNSAQLLIPASTQKLFCTAAALSVYGPSFRFETTICYTGSFDRKTGELTGDLIIRGSGDPSLQSKFVGKELITEQWAEILYNEGLRSIRGSVIGDAGAFPKAIPANWLYEDVSNYYGSPLCALNYRDNFFTISFSSGEAGTKATLGTVEPHYLSQAYVLTHSVIASGKSDEAYVYGDPGSFTRSIIGTIPANKKNYEVDAALPDPALLCAQDLQTQLKKKGIACRRTAESRYQTPSGEIRTVLYTHRSVTLPQLVQITNYNSNNLYCEGLRYLLGKGDEQKGLEQIKKYIKDSGADSGAVFLVDACGLSRLNACNTADQSLFLQNVANQAKSGSVFLSTLPVSGLSGGLATLGKGTVLENNYRGKSGYMTRARAYNGYLKTKSGKDIVFSIIINNFGCTGKAMKPKFEAFLLSLTDL